MKAVNKFKSLLWRRRPELMSGILGQGVQYVQPPLQLDRPGDLQKSKNVDLEDRRPVEGASISEEVHREIEPTDTENPKPLLYRMDSAVTTEEAVTKEQPVSHRIAQHSFDDVSPLLHFDTRRTHSTGDRGHAHDPMDVEPLWLGIGPGLEETNAPPEMPVCAESPTAAEFNIYDTAYQREVERIRRAKGQEATVYLTRRVDSKKEYQGLEVADQPHTGWKSVLDAAREKEKSMKKSLDEGLHGYTLADVAAHAVANTKAVGVEAMAKGQELSDREGTTMANVINKVMEKIYVKGEGQES